MGCAGLVIFDWLGRMVIFNCWRDIWHNNNKILDNGIRVVPVLHGDGHYNHSPHPDVPLPRQRRKRSPPVMLAHISQKGMIIDDINVTNLFIPINKLTISSTL